VSREDLLANAAECRELASRFTGKPERGFLLNAAGAWLELARRSQSPAQGQEGVGETRSRS
jgi:hypothetical protein